MLRPSAFRRSLEPDVSRRAGVDAARAVCAAASPAPCRSWSRYCVTRRVSQTAAVAVRDGSAAAMTAEDGLGGGAARPSPSATVSPRCDRNTDAAEHGAVACSSGLNSVRQPDAEGVRRSAAEGARTQRQWRRRRKLTRSYAAVAHLLILAVLAAAPLRSAALKIMLPEDGRECISQSLNAEVFEVCLDAIRQSLPRCLAGCSFVRARACMELRVMRVPRGKSRFLRQPHAGMSGCCSACTLLASVLLLMCSCCPCRHHRTARRPVSCASRRRSA